MNKAFRQYKFLLLCIVLVAASFAAYSCAKEASAKKLVAEPPVGNKPDTTATPPINPSSNYSSVPMDQFIGANGFHEDNLDNIRAVGTLRAYCNWDWFQGDSPNNEYIFQPSRGGWYFDEAFQKIKDIGVSPVICLQHTIKELRAGNKDDSHDEDKPLDATGANSKTANSYKSFANALYQMAARYGRTKVADNLLKVPAGQKKSGLDLVKYLEVWNEPDKDWKGPDGQFSAEEYAAMLSIAYDKIKEADPTMKVVMAGLATPSVDYLQKMKTWFEANRSDKKFPADVINIHMYAFNNKIVWGKTWPLFGPAETPEDAGFKKRSAEIVKYCKQNIAGTEVWISEFGWDTNTESPLCPKPIDGLSVKEVQARWLVRGFLAFAAGGIDRAQMFVLLDPSQDNIGTQFGTSGMIERTNFGVKKTSWYYVFTMKNTLRNMVMVGEESADNGNILIYKFKDPSSSRGAYVVWSNTSTNKVIDNFKLQFSKNVSTADMVELTDKQTQGTKKSLTVNNNSVSISVSEKPVFITVNNL